MRWSRLFIPTLRDDPAEAESIGHRLLLRAGYLRHAGGGTYARLFLAQRSLRKIAGIVREEMDAAGAQEMLLPALDPAAAGRALAVAAAGGLRSYRQLPQIWHQIQTAFEDAPTWKSGLAGVRQSLCLSAFSFDIDTAGLDAACEKLRQVCCRIFDRCGIEYLVVESRQSHRFVVISDAGDERVVRCPATGYAAGIETAAGRPTPPLSPDPEGDLEPEEFHTPGRKTIADVAELTGLPETSQMKSLVMAADGRPVLALVRGDHTMSETKFAAAARASEIRPASPEEIREWFGADAGSLGPAGVRNMAILADLALQGRRNMICGANKDDYHLRHVTPGEDFHPEYCDLRQVAPGDTSAGAGDPLEIVKAAEIGHITRLGSKLAGSLGLRVTNEAGQEVAPLMASCEIGIERVLAAAAELFHDTDGMVLPAAIAPFDVVITPVNFSDAAAREGAESLQARCREMGLDALLDDRDERPGVKFKDADLIGVPWRITVGKKLAQGVVEVVERRGRRIADVPAAGAPEYVSQHVR